MSAPEARFVVPTERHVDAILAKGGAAETRAALRERLLEALAPGVTLAGPEETRVLLDAGRGEHLATLDAIDDAISALRAANVTPGALDEAARELEPATARRARMLASAMRALDARLEEAGLVDGRLAGVVLAHALARAEPRRVAEALGAPRVVARFVLRWEPCDVVWWRALDARLSMAGGGASIELVAFDQRLDAARDPSPLDRVLDALARALDEAPRTAVIRAPLGDLRLEGAARGSAAPSVEIRQATDAHAQARAALEAVQRALGEGRRAQLDLFGGATGGAPLESVVIAVPSLDDETLAPLRAAFDDARIPLYEPRGASPSRSGAVATALGALALARAGLPRAGVAALLRSRYVDAAALGDEVLEVARALDETRTAAASDPVASLEATARAWKPDDAAPARAKLARRIGESLARVQGARTRREHASTARALWADLGLEARAVDARGAGLASDDPASGVTRAVLRAIGQDAHAWRALLAALDRCERAAARVGMADAPCSAETFAHELARALRSGAAPAAASRAGAVRVARMWELAGESLECLVVLDANEGVLPSAASGDALVPEPLATKLRARAAHAAPPSSQSRADVELAQLAAAAGGARRVVLCWRERDEAGAVLAPAPLVAWLERGGVRASRWSSAPIAQRPCTMHDALLARLAHAPDRAKQLAPDAHRRARVERVRESFFESGDNPRTSPVVGQLALGPELSSAVARDTGGARRPLSVTALERIATCAFQGFAGHVLRADERRPRAELPDAREGGTLLHGALAAAFQATAPLWRERPRDRARIEREAMAAADVALDRAAAASPMRRLLLDRLREHVSAVIAWSLDDEAWDFAEAERSFGDRSAGAWPPLVLEDDEVRVSLRGSIDRVDRAHAGGALRVIDYKTSERTALHATKHLGDTTFQIALYGIAAARALGEPATEGLYVAAHPAAVRSTEKRLEAARAKWREALAPIEGRAQAELWAIEAMRAFRAGGFAPQPTEKSACERCSFDGGCRKPRFVIRGGAADEEGEA